eukprot:Gb_27188 [translate_table: standard]
MLERLFGWGKASKCKSLIKVLRSRMKLLRNKRDIQVKLLRRDVAQLLGDGQDHTTLGRVDLLFKEQNLLAGYDMVEHFCECILQRLSYIRRHKDCPQDINEAVSSLIFAAARCADLPELQCLRSLFAKRYGHQFASAAVELFPDCGVNQQIIEKLSIRSPSSDAKLKLMKEIAGEFNVQWDSSNIEAELCEHPKSLRGSRESQKFISCQNGVDLFHDAPSHTSYVDSTSFQSENFVVSSIDQKRTNTVKNQEAKFSNKRNEMPPWYIGSEEKIFDRDIPVVSSSVKEILTVPDTIDRTLHVEKQNSLPRSVAKQSRHNNFGSISNGKKFMKSTSNSCAIVNVESEDGVHYVAAATAPATSGTAKSAEQAAGAAWWAASLAQSSKPLREGKIVDCPLDNSSKNAEDISDQNFVYQPDTGPVKSKHSSWTSTAKHRYCNRQFSGGYVNTCFPEVSEEQLEMDYGSRSAANLKSNRVYENKPLQRVSKFNIERQELQDCPETQENWKLHSTTRRRSPRTCIDLNKLGVSGIEDGRHRHSTISVHKEHNFKESVEVDEFRRLDRGVGRNVKHKELDFEDYIEVNDNAAGEHGAELQYVRRNRKIKRVRAKSNKRPSASSHYPIEMNSLYQAESNDGAHSVCPKAYRADCFATMSSRRENIARKAYYGHFAKSHDGVNFRRHSVHDLDTQEPPWQYCEDKFSSSSCNGGLVFYDEFHYSIDSDSGVGTSINGENICAARDFPSRAHKRLQSRKSVKSGNSDKKQNPFEELSHGTRKVYYKGSSNSEKRRSYEEADDMQENKEILYEIYNSNQQMIYPNEKISSESSSVGLHYELEQDRVKGTKLSPQYFSVNHKQPSLNSKLHDPDNPSSNKNLYHIDDGVSDQEQQHFQKSEDNRHYSKPALVRNYKSEERLYKGGQTRKNKPWKGRNISPELVHKHLYHVDTDGSDLEDQLSQQSDSRRKVGKATPGAYPELGSSYYDVMKTYENKPHRRSSKLKESCEEPECRGNKCERWPAKKTEKLWPPRVSVVYVGEEGKAQEHQNIFTYMEESEDNDFQRGRHGIPEAEPPPVEGKLHGNSSKSCRNASFDLPNHEKLQHPLDNAHNIQDAKECKSENAESIPDQVKSLNQSLGVLSLGMNTIPQNMKFSWKNSDSSSNTSSFPGFLSPNPSPTPPMTPPSSVSLEVRSEAKPYNSALPAMGPPQRPPPVPPCTWQRVVSLPTDRSRSSPVSPSVRSNSLQPNRFRESSSNLGSPHVAHVHPKLPDYDDLAAQFAALKQQHRTSNASE